MCKPFTSHSKTITINNCLKYNFRWSNSRIFVSTNHLDCDLKMNAFDDTAYISIITWCSAHPVHKNFFLTAHWFVWHWAMHTLRCQKQKKNKKMLDDLVTVCQCVSWHVDVAFTHFRNLFNRQVIRDVLYKIYTL